MKILLAHNAYQQSAGEDAVVAQEHSLLVEKGHQVIPYFRGNDELVEGGISGLITVGIEAVWSSRSCSQIARLLQSEVPDIAHFHNTFPLISPGAYYACRRAGVPVVQTLHNYRLLCPSGTLLREGAVCESCVGKSVPWPGVVHACYRHSVAATAALAAMLVTHRAIGTWRGKVDVYVALTEFARAKFLTAGFSGQLISVKPNFIVPDPGARVGRGHTALFVGRLSEEKGPQLLPEAWAKLSRDIPLEIIGDGPMRDMLEERCRDSEAANVRFHGWLDKTEVLDRLKRARFLIVPSVCYEGFPLAIAEAFACGVPVIASRLGAMAEIVVDGKMGLHFTAGDEVDLAAKVDWAWTHPNEMEEMGRAARREYEAKYTAAKNYEVLMEIYERALCAARRNAGN